MSEASAHPRDRLERSLGLRDASFLVVASVIGAGIFFTPGRVAELLPSPGWIFLAWGLGALLSLAGALANAELGAMFPRAGGDYVYLREGVHPVAGFLVGWLSFFAIYCGTIAALALVLGETVAGWFGAGEGAAIGVALLLTAALSWINYRGVRWGARANNLTSVFKIGALLIFCLLGPIFGDGDVGRLWSRAEGASGIAWVDFGRAMSPVLFSYLGWNASVYVASEIRKPERNIPASLFLGLAICAGIYFFMNAIYLYALPMEELRGVTDAGEASARRLFGGLGGSLVAGFVFISILGTLNATVLVGPRIAYAMSLDGLFFGGVDRVSQGYRTPAAAILAQALITMGLIAMLRSFPSALDFTTFAIVLATMADIVALYLLRIRRPQQPRPYRAWGYPLVPALYLLTNAAIGGAMFYGSPRDCAISVAMLLAGLPFYWWFQSRGRTSGAS